MSEGATISLIVDCFSILIPDSIIRFSFFFVLVLFFNAEASVGFYIEVSVVFLS